METHACPKCNTPMDEGYMSWSGSGQSGYVSKKQTGMLRVVTKIALAVINGGSRYAMQVVPGLVLTIMAAWLGWLLAR